MNNKFFKDILTDKKIQVYHGSDMVYELLENELQTGKLIFPTED